MIPWRSRLRWTLPKFVGKWGKKKIGVGSEAICGGGREGRSARFTAKDGKIHPDGGPVVP